MGYARKTTVSVAKSREDIENIVMRHGADTFDTRRGLGKIGVAFHFHGLSIQFVAEIPNETDEEFATDGRGTTRTADQRWKAWDQAVRQRWRALLLVIKAKLEATECEITTVEEEFMAHIVNPATGKTLFEHMGPALLELKAGRPLKMLPAPAVAEELLGHEHRTKDRWQGRQ